MYNQSMPWHPDSGELRIPVINEEGQLEYMTLDDRVLGGHVLTVGGTGVGKTNFLLQLALSVRTLYPDSLFVFLDPKGDYLELFHSGDRLVSFYPRPGDTYSYFHYNILDECLRSATPEDELHEIVKTLFSPMIKHSGSNQFFPLAASDLFFGFMLTELRKAQASVPATHKELCSQLFRMSADQLRQRLEEEGDLNDIVSNIPPARNGTMSNTTASVLAELSHFTRGFFLGSLAGDGHDSVQSFLNGPGGQALFLEYDAERKELSSTLFTLIVSTLIKKKLAVGADRRKVFLFLDEMSILKTDLLTDALARGRGNGLRVIGAVQSTEQLQDMHPENTDRCNTLSGAFCTMVAFRPNDEPTQKWIQNFIGETHVRHCVFGLSRYNPPNVFYGNEPLVDSWSLSSLGLGEAYVKKRELPHQKVKFLPYTGGQHG